MEDKQQIAIQLMADISNLYEKGFFIVKKRQHEDGMSFIDIRTQILNTPAEKLTKFIDQNEASFRRIWDASNAILEREPVA